MSLICAIVFLAKLTITATPGSKGIYISHHYHLQVSHFFDWEIQELADNIVNWVWPSYAKTGKVLLVEGWLPWGHSQDQSRVYCDSENCWDHLLTRQNIQFDIIEGANNLLDTHLDPTQYKMIIVEGKQCCQDESNCQKLKSSVTKIEDYVSSGGIYIDSVFDCDEMRYGSISGPFGIETSKNYSVHYQLVVPENHSLSSGITIGQQIELSSSGEPIRGYMTQLPSCATCSCEYLHFAKLNQDKPLVAFCEVTVADITSPGGISPVQIGIIVGGVVAGIVTVVVVIGIVVGIVVVVVVIKKKRRSLKVIPVSKVAKDEKKEDENAKEENVEEEKKDEEKEKHHEKEDENMQDEEVDTVEWNENIGENKET